MRETHNLEFKENVSNKFLKTVTAFANYHGARIIFGVSDDGKIKGLANIAETALIIENKINNSIVPKVYYSIKLDEETKTIELTVYPRKQKTLFKIFENSIEITLPVISGIEELSDNQNIIYNALENKELPSSTLSKITGFGKNKVLELIETLIELGYVKKIGSGRGTKYTAR